LSYIYEHVNVVRVIDGDTVEMEVDMGNHIRWRAHFRLRGINAPEMKTAAGPDAKAFLERLIGCGVARAQTFKPDKYGRWLVDIWTACEGGGDRSVNQAMIGAGHAVAYMQ